MGEKTRWSVNFKKYIGYLPEAPIFIPSSTRSADGTVWRDVLAGQQDHKTRTEELLNLVGCGSDAMSASATTPRV